MSPLNHEAAGSSAATTRRKRLVLPSHDPGEEALCY